MSSANILKINTLGENWSDKDIVLLHACFQLLTDCIEKEKLIETTDWEQNEDFRNAKLEIECLYDWWNKRIKAEQENIIDPLWTKDQYDNDTEMIIRLIKMRKYLWT